MSAGEGPVQTDGQPAPRTASRTQEEVQRTHRKINVWLVRQIVRPGLLLPLCFITALFLCPSGQDGDPPLPPEKRKQVC